MSLIAGAPIVARGDGPGLMEAWWKILEATTVDVLYDTPAHDLIVEGDHVLGVRARTRDSFTDFHGIGKSFFPSLSLELEH